jgi:endoglucanase
MPHFPIPFPDPNPEFILAPGRGTLRVHLSGVRDCAEFESARSGHKACGLKSPSQFRAAIRDLLGSEAKTEEFYAAWRTHFFNESDVAALKASGVNSLRIPFHYKDVYNVAAKAPDAAGLKWLDSCAVWGERHKVYMILDMHVAPGGQNPMEHSDIPAEPGKLFAGTVEDYDFYGELTARVWKAIAARYKDNAFLAYDLINEPLVTDQAQHWRLAQIHPRITDSIRSVDKKHLIIAEGNWYGSWVQPLGARWDENMAFSTHNYWTKVPDVKRSGQVDWSVAQNVPIWHGESGENSNVWYNTEIRDLESKGIGWSWWTFKMIDGVSGGYNTNGFPVVYLPVLEYWKNNGPKPTPEAAYDALMGLADFVRMESCHKNHDVFDALFRADHHLTGAPFANLLKDVPEDPHNFRTLLKASEYDMGTQGVAYSDSAFMTVSNHKDSSVAWNKGWTLRNDGVELYWDGQAFDHYIGETSAGEWVAYTVNVLEAGPYSIALKVGTPNADRTLRLEMGGISLGEVVVPNTTGWTAWEDATLPRINLKAGRQTLKVTWPKPGVNLIGVVFTALEPSVALASRRTRPGVGILSAKAARYGLEITYGAQAGGRAEAQVSGVDGKAVWNGSFDVESGARTLVLPVGNLGSGVYGLRVSGPGIGDARLLFVK